MIDHMRKLGMDHAAEVFAREAGIGDTASGLNLLDGFLGDWWCVFWECYNVTMYGRSNDGVAMAESSAQAEVRAQAQAQAQALIQAQAHAEAWTLALAMDQVQAQALAQAQAEIQAQTLTLANNGMLTYEPYGYTTGQASVQQFPLYAENAIMMSQPILVATWNDEQQGVLPYDINANFQPGCAVPGPSSNPRNNAGQSSQRSRRRANRSGSQTGRGNGSNPA